MTLPLASLYDISLGIHQVAGLGLVLIAVAVTVISQLARSDEPLLERGLAIKKAAGPLAGILVLTGIYQLLDHHVKFFQSWMIGAICLLIGFMGVLDGTWTPVARQILAGETEGEELKRLKTKSIVLGASMIIMLIAATGLMESKPG